ncbi:MAG TPA: (E)-4-hydroxy-3-methylbut-2-enyl-diphosphate synthase [Spirochaetota bacterium]|nr:(E)-4-hydroxy-3-methylbut-2-enyl-diphosphate synthase [Spirochaetota bacterium]
MTMQFPFTNSYKRVPTRVVRAGNLSIGGDNPVRLQSMTNTLPSEIDRSIEQIKELQAAGCELVRLAVPSVKEARQLAVLKKKLQQQKIFIPLCADIHFQPHAAELAAAVAAKVRINPGNYSEKKFVDPDMDKTRYQEHLNRIGSRLKSLIKICKENQTAVRIGVNHGSLSPRISSRYGNTPAGMVASALEFIELFEKEHFKELVISLKASNTAVMVHACRLFIAQLKERGRDIYPLHLGVTEAGSGETGRIKSVIGCGALLTDGIGDTIRVSLTEKAVSELKTARQIADYARTLARSAAARVNYRLKLPHPFSCRKPDCSYPKVLENFTFPLVVAPAPAKHSSYQPDIYCAPAAAEAATLYFSPAYTRLYTEQQNKVQSLIFKVYKNDPESFTDKKQQILPVISVDDFNQPHTVREQILFLRDKGVKAPVILRLPSFKHGSDTGITTALFLSGLLLDGLLNGIQLCRATAADLKTVFLSLQAAGRRVSQAEYITCPTCGRTNFNIEKTAAVIKKKTSHLKGVKIGIMGCIVNGPGEMADSDVGYVGSGPGKVHLYLGKDIYKKNVPQSRAVEELIKLLKKEGFWQRSEQG